jgi:phospholipase/carboxylesterase
LRGKVLENVMPRFFRRLAEGVLDLDDLKKRTHKLADFVVAATHYYKIDIKRIVAVGYSNGANIAASRLLRRPEILWAAILFRTMVPLIPEKQPNLSSKSIFISAGAHDPIIPVSNAKELVELLRSARTDVTIRFFRAGTAFRRFREPGRRCPPGSGAGVSLIIGCDDKLVAIL